MSVLLLVILFGLVAAEKPVPGYGIPQPSVAYAPQKMASYVTAVRPNPSKKEEIEAKILPIKDGIHTKLEELKAKIPVVKSTISDKLSGVKSKITDKLSDLKAKIPVVKSKISDKLSGVKSKISDTLSGIKSKLQSKHTKPAHHGPIYVLVPVQPKSKYSW